MILEFYHRGIQTFDKSLQEKIRRDSKRCWWHDKEDKHDENFTGYITEDGLCYDVCSYNSQKRFHENVQLLEKREQDYVNKFLEIKNTVLISIKIIQDFISSLANISEIKGKIKAIKKKIENGYVMQDFNIRGGKKTRRYKKDNRRFLTEKEITDLKQDLCNFDKLETELSKKIRFEEILENIIGNMYNINYSLMYTYNNRFEWHETVGLYNNYLTTLENLKLRINHFTFNTYKEKYEIQQKELDISLEDITIFEETFEKIIERVEEDKKAEEMMTVKDRREVTKKAKFYIDENGKRIELDQNIEQIVIHR